MSPTPLLLLFLLAPVHRAAAQAQTGRCAQDEATCADGSCIGRDRRCDGYEDCPDGSDELSCSSIRCQPNEFKCNNQKCVMKNWRCDGDNDCGDNSDEQDCRSNEPGSQCLAMELQCADGRQCVPRTFQCDNRADCQDGSDEVGCAAPTIVEQPPAVQVITLGSVFVIRCRAVGTPTPEISWRRNWDHVPDKCEQLSEDGSGTLRCPDAAEADQGAYSCEAINTQGVVFAIPDTNVVVTNGGLCQPPVFNSAALTNDDCQRCFCFGVSTSCYSSGLFMAEMPPLDPRGVSLVSVNPFLGDYSPIPVQESPFPTAAGVQARIPTVFDGAIFFSLPDSHLGDQLNSYGGYVRFSLSTSPPTDTPVLVMQGNGVTITYVTDIEPQGGYYDIQVTEGNFLKATGDASEPDPVASREDIMMVLQDMGLLLISAHPSAEGLASMGDFRMDTASVVDSPRGPASLVESCRCPAGYTGLSCQECAEGYQRADGAWLGQCVPVPEECPDGQYGDPARGIACRSCPCPGPQYQYSQTCYLDQDDQVTCNCPEGFAGRRCESCAAGYRGNPLQGQACAPGGECDAAGSLEEDPDPRTGQCPCKEFATGRRCDRCKPRAFHLAPSNAHGCVPCFCMGVTDQCSSCGWFRNQVSAVFYNDDQGVAVTDRLAEEELADVSVNSESRQLEIYDLGSEPVYWSLPAKFLGDKVTAYGGALRFTQSHQAGYQQGLSEREADVELMGNDVRLLYKAPGPSLEERLPANQTHSVVVPLLETAWMRHDGGPVDREHLMMALADLDYIVIKTAMTRNADIATLADVSLDVATPRETGQAQAFSVEQCSCPVGYKGLSCEDCDVGYTRSLSGLYLRRCEPCECGGRSDECDPETGECLNCRDNTEGPACDQCVAGYSGDPLRGQPCRPDASAQGSCNCDPRGSLSASCDRNLQCPCKENVEGTRCDRCRSGSFGLGSDEVSGCSSCFCSGVSDRCSEARLYRTHVPMQVVNRQHGFSVVKSSGEEVAGSDSIDSDFSLNMVSYAPAGDSDSPLYWSLPDLFTGEQLKSYGGSLQWRQEIAITTTAPASDDNPFNVVLQGGGISLGKIAEPGSTERSVALSAEAGWVDLESGSAASRATLMSVLSDLDALLILAVPAFSSGETSLRDVVLDTAIGTDTYQGFASGIEQCRCPVGYTGLSCQDCAAGHYEDSEGTCQRCPCNGNEQACGLGDDGQVVCDCKPNFSGDGCQTEEGAPEEPAVPPRATISPRYLQLNAGDRASFDCSAEGNPQPDLQWSGGRGGVFEPDVNAVGGVLAIASVRKAHEAEYTCTATNAAGTDSVRTIIYVRGEQAPPRRGDQQSQPENQPDQEDRRREQEERRRQEEERRRQEEERRRQDEERRRAEADRQRQEEERRRQEQERRRQEEERRRAEAERRPEQPEGQPEQTERQPEPSRRPPPAGGAPSRRYSPLQVQPQRHSAFAGDSVELQCLSADSAFGQYEWSRARGQPLSSSASMVDDTLVIGETSAEDRGGYICTAQTADGRRAQASAFVDVQEATLPRLQLYPADRQQVNREGSALFQCRVLSGNPQPEVIWKRADSEDGQLPSTAQSLPGGVLRFIRVQGDEAGDYTCEATSRAGQVVKTATLTVVAAPEITLYQPVQYRVREGEDVELQCGASGAPEPIVRWEGPRRPDGISGTSGGGSSSAKILLNSVSVSDGGIYTCRADNEVGRTSSRLRLIVEQVRAGGGRPPVSYPPRQRYTRPEAPEVQPEAPETQPEAPEGPGAAPVDHGSGDVAPSQGNIQPTSEEYVVPLNGRAELTCQVVDASAPVSISWVRSDGAMPADHIIRGGTLYLNRVQKDAEGSYTCLGLSGSEVVLFQAVATLRVIEPPQVLLEPQRQVVRPGDQVSIECSASGDPPVRLDWSRLGGQLPSAASAIDGALVFGAIAVSDAGRYVCTAENAAGRAQGYSDVLVNAGPPVAYPSSSAASPSAASHSSSAASPAAASEPSHAASHAAASEPSHAASHAAASEPSHAASHAAASEPSHAASHAAASEPSHAASHAAASEPSHAASHAAASEPSHAASHAAASEPSHAASPAAASEPSHAASHAAASEPSHAASHAAASEPSHAASHAAASEPSHAASHAAASEPSHAASHAAASEPSHAASPAAASEPSHAASHAAASEPSHAASHAAASEPSHAASPSAASEPSHAASHASHASEPSSAAAALDHFAPSSAAAAPAPSPVSPAATSPVASPSVAAVQQQVQAYVGSTVTLRCEGSGFDGQLSWARADRREIDRATTDGDSLTISELEEADSGDYRCYVRNYYGYSEDIVRLTVVPAPVAPELPCAPGELPCASGECMAADAFCDGFPDCSDGSDESQCRSPLPPAADDSTSSVADDSETAAPAADSGAAHGYGHGPELAEEQGAGDEAAAAEEDEAANYDEEEPAPAAEEEEAYDGEDYTVPDAEEETDLPGDLADEYDYADYYADYYKEE